MSEQLEQIERDNIRSKALDDAIKECERFKDAFIERKFLHHLIDELERLKRSKK